MPFFVLALILLPVVSVAAQTSTDDAEFSKQEITAHTAETNGAPSSERLHFNQSVAMVEQAIMTTRVVSCEASRFYTIDGTCNNLNNPRWGAAFEPFVRDLPNKYNDSKLVPRLYSETDPLELLPSAREVSVRCVPSLRQEGRGDISPNLNQNLMQFGQYLSHDTGLSPVQEGFNCCSSLDERGLHPDTSTGGPCFPIVIPDNDRRFNDCMPFNRSVYEIDAQGVAQQMNAATHVIDQSTVYGSSQTFLKSIRLFQKGLLRTDRFGLLPQYNTQKCLLYHPLTGCPVAGDKRVNVWPGLTVTHLIFHLEHNRVAGELGKVHPGWSDDRLFEEARAIVIAETQNLVYSQFLPIVLGRRVMRFFGLNRPASYNPHLNPSIINSFQTAAFRYGHSQINNFFVLYPQEGVTEELKNLYFRPHTLFDKYDTVIAAHIVNSLMTHPGQRFDPKMAESLTDFLFLGVDVPGASSDLAARNVQRGRDHGLPPFIDFLDRALQEFGADNDFVRRVRLPECSAGLYRSVRDVDLFIGGLYEKAVRGGVVGPTFAYLIGKQFKHLREGDRLFFDTKGSQAGFTAAQIKSIKKTSFAGIICRTTGLDKIQKKAFKVPHPKRNPIVNCDTLPDVDFHLWK